MRLTADDVSRADWCDVVLRGFTWKDNETTLVLIIGFPPNRGPFSDKDANLVCRWASGLRIDLAWDEMHTGPPLSVDAAFDRIGGDWSVAFDFANNGSISFRCAEIELIGIEGTSNPN